MYVYTYITSTLYMMNIDNVCDDDDDDDDDNVVVIIHVLYTTRSYYIVYVG